MVWCPSCDIRLYIKRHQESLHNKMLGSSSNKRSKSVVEVGESVLIPIARPDTMSSIGPRNITGCITGREDDLYTIETTEGILANSYTRNQFDICSSQLLSVKDIPSRVISQTEAMLKASLGIESGSSCRCKFCKTNRCPCRKGGRICNSRCHKGKACCNYSTTKT